MVASEKEEGVLEFQLVAQQEDNSLYALCRPVNVVAEEEIPSTFLAGEAVHLENSYEVEKLTVNVAADADWRVQLK